MSILVAYKYAANPQDATAGADGSIDWSRAKKSVSEYDPVAIQVGRNLADAAGAELVGISAGPADIAGGAAKKNAMSKGFDRGLILADAALEGANATTIAAALAALVKREAEAQLVLTGDASIDEGARLVSALLAAHLGWPCLQNVAAVEAAGEGWSVTQNLPGGASRTVELAGPAVLACTSDAATPKAASMKEILAAAKKPVEVLAAADLEGFDAQGAAPAARAARPAEAVTRKNVMLEGSPEDISAELIAALRADGVL